MIYSAFFRSLLGTMIITAICSVGNTAAAQNITALDSSFAAQGILKPDSLPIVGKSFMVLQADGRILTAVAYVDPGQPGRITYYLAVRRFLTDGRPDSSFNDSGWVSVPIPEYATAAGLGIQRPGRIVALASTGHYQGNAAKLFRFRADGRADSSFNLVGSAEVTHAGDTAVGHQTAFCDLAIDTGDRIWIGGLYDYRFTDIHRYTPDGRVDSTFGQLHTQLNNGAAFAPNDLIMLPDGRITVCGTTIEQSASAGTSLAVARYSPFGSFDSAFNGRKGYIQYAFPGQYRCIGHSLAYRPDGSMLMAGTVTYRYDGTVYLYLLALRPNGAIDNAWGINGVRFVDSLAYGVHFRQPDPQILVQPDGRILTTFGSASGSGKGQFTVYRLLADGRRDPSLGYDGQLMTPLTALESTAECVALQQDGKILISGNYQSSWGGRLGLVRYKPDVTLGVPALNRPPLQLRLVPNPVQRAARLTYELSGNSAIKLDVLGMDGAVQTTIMSGVRRTGGAHTEWIYLPESLPAGIYMLRLQAEGRQSAARFLKL